MQKTVVIDVVGLAPALIGEHTPRIKAFMDAGNMATIIPEVPAVTCSAQSTYITGVRPDEHGIVGNGWYFRDECEIKFWRQSNKLVQAPKIWEKARDIDPDFTVSKMFWWYNMYSSADYSLTPRPMYPADGRKLPDVYSQPPGLRDEMQAELGQFPLFEFWGPRTTINSTQWIADSSIRVDQKHDPTLTLIYLPHLDYGLQIHGPVVEKMANDLREVDTVVGQLIDYYLGKNKDTNIIILSEYGIIPVDTPIHLNRIFRENGLITVREELGLELLDAGACKAFAVADHQIAHVYVNDPDSMPLVRKLIEQTPGVATILDEEGKKDYHLNHERAGDLVVLSEKNAWFTYYYWLDDNRAPDFARCVDIHRKPGYDPVELFIDPNLTNPMLHAGFRLMQKKLGFRYLMDLTPLDATLVKGSHGVPTAPEDGPLLISNSQQLAKQLQPEAVYKVIWESMMEYAKA